MVENNNYTNTISKLTAGTGTGEFNNFVKYRFRINIRKKIEFCVNCCVVWWTSDNSVISFTKY